ncbi:hypothetical protein N2152v2_009483 [Parachlorella kessleri]
MDDAAHQDNGSGPAPPAAASSPPSEPPAFTPSSTAPQARARDWPALGEPDAKRLKEIDTGSNGGANRPVVATAAAAPAGPTAEAPGTVRAQGEPKVRRPEYSPAGAGGALPPPPASYHSPPAAGTPPAAPYHPSAYGYPGSAYTPAYPCYEDRRADGQQSHWFTPATPYGPARGDDLSHRPPMIGGGHPPGGWGHQPGGGGGGIRSTGGGGGGGSTPQQGRRTPRPPGSYTPVVPKDAAMAAAININKRITAAATAQEILSIVAQDADKFDTVCLATCMHKLANLRGAPNLHAQIVQAPEFYKLKHLIVERRKDFTARNISNTVWSLAKMSHHPGDDFLGAMGAEMAGKAGEGNAQNVANALWAFATLGYHPGEECLAALAEACKAKLFEFTAQNISNAVLSFAKLEFIPRQEIVDALAQEALVKTATFSPQALSNTLWALSKLEIKSAALMEAIGQEARGRLAEFNSQNLANSVWAYANLGVNPGDGSLLQDFAREAIEKMQDFSPQNISNFLWAFAKLDVDNHELFEIAGRHAARVMHTFQPQSIANMIWAYATKGEPPEPAYLQGLVRQAARLRHEFSPQNLSNTAWALATLKDSEAVQQQWRGLVPLLCQEVGARLSTPDQAGDFSRQHLANFVWALATLDYDPGKKLLQQVAQALCERADKCNPQEVSNSVWAYTRLGCYHGGLMDTMAAEATRRIDEFSQQNLANLAWSFAKLAHLDDGLLGALAGQAARLAGELSLQHLTNIVWAFASLHFDQGGGVLPALVAEVRRRLGDTQFNAQQLSNLLWSLAVIEHPDKEVWDKALGQLRTLSPDFSDLPEEALTQVFQAYMLNRTGHASGSSSPGGGSSQWEMPEDLLHCSHEAWLRSTKKIKISEFHSEVSRMLSTLGVDHTIEHLTDDQLFSGKDPVGPIDRTLRLASWSARKWDLFWWLVGVDIALPGERIALEVDGPHHFTSNTFQPLGEMYARRSLLEARGWRVVSLPFYHWSGASEEQRQALLRRLLAEAREGRASHPTAAAAHAAAAAAICAPALAPLPGVDLAAEAGPAGGGASPAVVADTVATPEEGDEFLIGVAGEKASVHEAEDGVRQPAAAEGGKQPVAEALQLPVTGMEQLPQPHPRAFCGGVGASPQKSQGAGEERAAEQQAAAPEEGVMPSDELH